MKTASPFAVITPHEKEIELHHERLKIVKKRLDTDNSHAINAMHSPRPKKGLQDTKQAIAKENLSLAKRIFEIMEKPSPIVGIMNDTKLIDRHPGTLNFRNRLTEAQRIHNQNMLLATRLDSMQPYYKKADLCVILNTTKRSKRPKSKKKKTRFEKEMDMVLNSQGQTNTPYTARSVDSPTDFAERTSTTDGDPASSSRYPLQSHNVLLEYTKVQDGRILEIAVIKEPFRDRYAIFGIDVDDGQRYELRLSSEEVTNILDGDILVTSVDNIEVWLALLTKVELRKVETFVKALPGSAQRLLLEDYSPATASRGGPAVADEMDRPTSRGRERVPSRPVGIRPSSGGGGNVAARVASLRPVLEQSGRGESLPRERSRSAGKRGATSSANGLRNTEKDISNNQLNDEEKNQNLSPQEATLPIGDQAGLFSFADADKVNESDLIKSSIIEQEKFLLPVINDSSAPKLITATEAAEVSETTKSTPKKSPRVVNLKPAEDTVVSGMVPTAPVVNHPALASSAYIQAVVRSSPEIDALGSGIHELKDVQIHNNSQSPVKDIHDLAQTTSVRAISDTLHTFSNLN